MRIIAADINSVKGPLNRYFSACVGAGRAGEVMRHVPMQQLKALQADCPFRYIRFHGLFHEAMNLVSRCEDGSLSFNFLYADLLFDSLLETGIRPIVELGLMPEALAKEQQYVFWWKMNKSMPKDLSEWARLVEALVRHLTGRYGEEEIKQWYFEVWNEPNHPAFFTEHKNIDAYFQLYDAAAFAVKRVCPAYRVGGPATAGMAWIKDTIDHCRQNGVPLDFITSHDYGVRGAFDPDGRAVTRLCPVDFIPEHIREGSELCKEAGLPLIITEWSASYSPRDPVHDSYFSAPYILHVLKKCEGMADMFSYWTYTDVFEETAPPPAPFHGGFGLFNVQSIPKPSYYAYRFLSRLGNAELNCADPEAWVCRSDGEVQALLWNIVQPDIPGDNRDYFTCPLPAKALENAEFRLSGLEPNREYAVSIETIGYRSGDPYNAWLDGCFADLPTREETRALIEQSRPKKVCFPQKSAADGTLHLSLPQAENQADLVTVSLR